MNVHILQHVPFEGPGSFSDWLAARRATVTFTRFFEDPALPDPSGLDLVLAMGGPMSVNDEAELPWLVDEKRFIRRAIELGIPVLGVCLGSQLIASALGARVYPNREREIGWFPVAAAEEAGEGSSFRFPPSIDVFHWHGETFDLPPGAVRLAGSAACENQAFQIGRHAIGLQFHLETTPESLDLLIEHCGDELLDAPYVQSAERMRQAGPDAYAEIHALADRLLDHLTDRAGELS